MESEDIRESTIKQYNKLRQQAHTIRTQQQQLLQYQQRIQAIENTYSWRLTAPLRTFWFTHHGDRAFEVFLNFLEKLPVPLQRLRTLKLVCDRAEFSGKGLIVSGWALSDAPIESIDITCRGTFVGQPEYGLPRPDVRKHHPWVKGSGRCGFSLVADISELKIAADSDSSIVIRAVASDGIVAEKSVPCGKSQYHQWIEMNEPDQQALAHQKQTAFPAAPTISIITPVYNTSEAFLVDMLESVLRQTYPHWELCIADGGSSEPHVKETLESYAARDSRIRVTHLPQNRGISENSNAAIGLASGEWLTFLDHDDTLAPFALFEVLAAIQNISDVDLLYSDEDKISEAGYRHEPFFKPDWSPDMLRSCNYIAHFTAIRKELLNRLGGFRSEYDGSQDYDLILRATEQARRILHISKILYHWRTHQGSTAQHAGAKPYADAAGFKALESHLHRQKIGSSVENTRLFGTYRVRYDRQQAPFVSIIIPNHDHADVLERGVMSILHKTVYRHIEILIVENGSHQHRTFELYEKLSEHRNIRILTWTDDLFNYAAINNWAVQHAAGDVLLFLNNDTEVINRDWFECLLAHALRPEIGAVGAKLYYPDDTIQHAGVILGMGGIAGHPFRGFPANAAGYFGRLRMIHNVSAVTGACLMVRKAVFEEVGGFDERYILAFNDVDMCLKIRQHGYLNVWTPYAELYHHESKTRGAEDTPDKQQRFQQEISLFQENWKGLLEQGDPYYSPHLTLDAEDFSLNCSLPDERSADSFLA